MYVRYAASVFFSIATLLLASLFCYLGLASNGALLGKTPDIPAYLGAIAVGSSYFVVPLLIGTSCSPFIEAKKLPWLTLALVGLGIWADFVYGNSFLALLIIPFNIIASWALAISCLRITRKIVVLPLLVASSGLVLASVIGYAEFTDQQAEARAHALCVGTKAGQSVGQLLADAKREEKHPKYVRWVQVNESIKNAEGTVRVLYRGTNLVRGHVCEVKIAGGMIVEGKYAIE